MKEVTNLSNQVCSDCKKPVKKSSIIKCGNLIRSRCCYASLQKGGGMSDIFDEPRIKGIVKNTCKRCGKTFQKAFFEDENEEKGHGNYCLPCILGIKADWEMEKYE